MYKPGDRIPDIKCPVCLNVDSAQVVGPERPAPIAQGGDVTLQTSRTYPAHCTVCKTDLIFETGPRTLSRVEGGA